MESSKKSNPISNMIILIVVIALGLFMFRIMWKDADAQNPVTKNNIEKRAKEYLETNYPGVYEQVQTQNSGVANPLNDDLWSVHYFSRENNSQIFSPVGNISFTLVFDENLNIIEDGYRDYYLNGGYVYSKNSNEFYRNLATVLYPVFEDGVNAPEAAYMAKIEDVDFESISFYQQKDGYAKYIGDYLDPEKNHDFVELALKYGYANLKFFMTGGGYEDYQQLVKDVVKLLQDNNLPYNKLRVYVWFRESDTIFCEGNFMYGDINADFEKAFEEGSYILTEAEYTRMKNAGEELPQIEVGAFLDIFDDRTKEEK